MNRLPIVLSVVAITTVLGVTASQAAPVNRDEITMSSHNCQTSLPVFDGNVRKRPLAVQNEGTTGAFITCAFAGTTGALPTSTLLAVILRNNVAAAANVSCTLVDGRNNIDDPVFLVKTVPVPGNSAGTIVIWSAAGDNGGINFIYPAVSCLLPPGIGIQATYRQYPEEIGL